MTGSIIQWNLRGHNANRPNLELLDSKYSPSVICLQETMLKDGNMTFKGFEPHHKPGTVDAMGRAHGGVSIWLCEIKSSPKQDYLKYMSQHENSVIYEQQFRPSKSQPVDNTLFIILKTCTTHSAGSWHTPPDIHI